MEPTRAAAALLERHALAMGADVHREERAGLVRFRRGDRPFLILRVLQRRVDVAFTRMGRARSKRILDAKVARLPHLPYRVVVEAPGDVDTELLTWLRESYEAVE